MRAFKTKEKVDEKRMADLWKDLIDPRVYESLYKYEVKNDRK